MTAAPEYKWKNFPEEKPTQSGYYMTVHLWSEKRTLLYKGIYWNNDKQHWCHWRRELIEKGERPNVIAFVSETRRDFYGQCLGDFMSSDLEPYQKETQEE